MLGLGKTIKETAFRMKLRKALSNETKECLEITLDEVKREIERRNRHGRSN